MRPSAVTLIIALLVLSIPAYLRLLPGPIVHDEWAYLLQADTFARGRLANPPHPHWKFFETIHVLQQPTYASKFPPFQGLTLAAGQLVGNPVYGVIVTLALACAAITWMLVAIMPRPWAVAGGVLAAMQPIVFHWGQSYWGGGAAMLAAAIFCGALLRLYRRQRWQDAALLGIGIGLLANSRPLEGLLLVILCSAAFVNAIQPSALLTRKWLTCAMWIGLALLPIAAWMMFYNFRVTGAPLRLPYAEHTAQYMHAPLFWWQAPRDPPVSYRHEDIRRFHVEGEPGEWQSQVGEGRLLAGILRKSGEIWRDWFSRSAIAVPLLAAFVLMRSRRVWLAAGVCVALPLAHFLMTPWFRPHYLAVLAPLVFGLAACGIRILWLRHAVGKLLVDLVFAWQAVVVVLLVRVYIISPSIAGLPRQEVVDRLQQIGGRHVVFVRYEGDSHTIMEWVYNSADIDSQQIIFARDRGEENLQVLGSYYPDRGAWLVTVRGLAYDAQLLQRQ